MKAISNVTHIIIHIFRIISYKINTDLYNQYLLG
jgi:hypothetical protein